MKFFESVESIFSFIVRWILLERIVFLTWLLIQKFSHSQSKLSSFVISNPLLNNDMLERHGNPFCQHFIEQFRPRILMQRIRSNHIVFKNWNAICQSHGTSSNDGFEKFHSKIIQLNWSTVEKTDWTNWFEWFWVFRSTFIQNFWWKSWFWAFKLPMSYKIPKDLGNVRTMPTTLKRQMLISFGLVGWPLGWACTIQHLSKMS